MFAWKLTSFFRCALVLTTSVHSDEFSAGDIDGNVDEDDDDDTGAIWSAA